MNSDDPEFKRLLAEAVELHIASEDAFRSAREIDHRASLAWHAALKASGMKKSTDFRDVFVGRCIDARAARERGSDGE